MRLDLSSILALSATAALSACVEGPIAAPPPQQSLPSSRVMPKPAQQEPEPTVVTGNWIDAPLTQGNWGYRPSGNGSMALYGPPGASAHFVMTCDRAAGKIALSRAGASAGKMTLRATSGLKDYASIDDPKAPAHSVVTLAPNDPQLDALIYSRGRFMVSATDSADLIVPSWSEVARVVEDCR